MSGQRNGRKTPDMQDEKNVLPKPTLTDQI